MTRDALSARDAAASEHANVSGGGQQEDGTEEEAHASGDVVVGVVEGLDAERGGGDCAAETDQEGGPVSPAYDPAATGKPRSGDHVEGNDAADDVAPLGFHDGETKAAGGQRHHRDGEDVSGGAMQPAAFANGHREGASKQANGATENVQNQQWESHGASWPWLPMMGQSARENWSILGRLGWLWQISIATQFKRRPLCG